MRKWSTVLSSARRPSFIFTVLQLRQASRVYYTEFFRNLSGCYGNKTSTPETFAFCSILRHADCCLLPLQDGTLDYMERRVRWLPRFTICTL